MYVCVCVRACVRLCVRVCVQEETRLLPPSLQVLLQVISSNRRPFP